MRIQENEEAFIWILELQLRFTASREDDFHH